MGQDDLFKLVKKHILEIEPLRNTDETPEFVVLHPRNLFLDNIF